MLPGRCQGVTTDVTNLGMHSQDCRLKPTNIFSCRLRRWGVADHAYSASLHGERMGNVNTVPKSSVSIPCEGRGNKRVRTVLLHDSAATATVRGRALSYWKDEDRRASRPPPGQSTVLSNLRGGLARQASQQVWALRSPLTPAAGPGLAASSVSPWQVPQSGEVSPDEVGPGPLASVRMDPEKAQSTGPLSPQAW